MLQTSYLTPPNRVTCQIKAMPSDPRKLKETKWEKQASGPAGVHVANVRPTLQHQRWIVDTEEGPVNIHFPGETVPDFCKKIHALHKKDETKFPLVMTKAASKKEGHPYNANPDKAKTDCDALAKCVNPCQMSDDMEPLKSGLMGLEDLLPGNNATVIASISNGYGAYLQGKDEPPELGTADKILMMKDEKLADPTTAVKVLEKQEELMRKGTETIMMGVCKALGMTQEELLPDLPAYLDIANGKKPFCQTPYNKFEKYQKHMGEGFKPPTGAELEEFRRKQVNALLEGDAKVENEKKELDKNPAELRKVSVERQESRIEYCREAVAPAPEDKLTKGTRVFARWKKFGYYEGTLEGGVQNGKINDTEEGKYCVVKFDDTDVDNVAVANIAIEKPEPAPEDELVPGAKVRARFYGDIFMDGVIKSFKNGDGTYVVAFDLIFTQNDVKAKDIRRRSDLSAINKEGTLIPKTFYDVNFSWVQTEEDLNVTLNLWREGDEKNVQVCTQHTTLSQHHTYIKQHNNRNTNARSSRTTCATPT